MEILFWILGALVFLGIIIFGYRKILQIVMLPIYFFVGVIMYVVFGPIVFLRHKFLNKEIQKLKQLAEQGYASAQFDLGEVYRKGEKVGQDYEEAVRWYSKSAEQGNADAQNNLGGMYKNGNGVNQSSEYAVKWYSEAAEQGFALAQHNLGRMYFSGDGVEQSSEKAFKWFCKAAEQGDAEAQLSLGAMYYYEKVVKKNNELGLAWLFIAKANSNAKAIKLLGKWSQESITDEVLKQAQNLADKMIKENPQLLQSNHKKERTKT